MVDTHWRGGMATSHPSTGGTSFLVIQACHHWQPIERLLRVWVWAMTHRVTPQSMGMGMITTVRQCTGFHLCLLMILGTVTEMESKSLGKFRGVDSHSSRADVAACIRAHNRACNRAHSRVVGSIDHRGVGPVALGQEHILCHQPQPPDWDHQPRCRPESTTH